MKLFKPFFARCCARTDLERLGAMRSEGPAPGEPSAVPAAFRWGPQGVGALCEEACGSGAERRPSVRLPRAFGAFTSLLT